MASTRSERTTTDRRNRPYFVPLVLALVALLSAPRQSSANELKEETKAAWENYIGSYISSSCLRAEVSAKESAFLRVNELPQGSVRLRAGETLVWREKGDHPPRVPHGLIHDSIGAIFIPNVTIADVLAVTRDYDRYSEIYSPAVIKAKTLRSTRTDDDFSMLLMQKVVFVTAALQGEFETRYVQIDSRHWYSLSNSTSLQAIEHFGQPDMRILPQDRGPGYVWRLLSLAKFEETNDGVYIELEALGLSRDVPTVLRWLVEPIVERLPKDSMRATLEETRKAVLARISQED
jgi:hypothetical protein